MFLPLILGLVALYVILSVVLPAQMGRPAKLLCGLAVLICAERLPILRQLTGALNTFLPLPVFLVTSYLQNLVLVLALLALFRDSLRLVFWLGHQVSLKCSRTAASRSLFRRMGRFMPHSLLLTLFATLLTGYGMFEALRVPSVREVRMVIPNLPPALEGFRIAQLSDLHIGPAFGREWLDSLVQETNELRPDLTVITGDVVDGSPERLKEDIAPLETLRARYGVFIAVGNHEYLSGLSDWKKAFSDMGIPVLLNSHTTLDVNGTPLVLAGTADPMARRTPEAEQPQPAQLMDAITRIHGNGVTTLMLAHNPALAPESARSGASAQLSGHTHGGLILPLAPLVALYNEGYVSDLYRVENMALYVNRGAGLWGGFPLRLLVPSEISLITLSKAKP